MDRMGTRVFVGGLTYRVRERDLERFFRKFGRVKEVAMKNGFAFVEFDDHRDADDAVYELNGKELMGERVSVEKARGTPRGSDVWRGTGQSRRIAPLPRRPTRAYDRGMKRNDFKSGKMREPDHRMQDRYGPPTRTEYRLIVENLSSRVSWQVYS
uniref:RRM domain-containing protein n=1 Tax=Clastoptera arizonana TaxID=38151 RepID=A0A1B6DQ13_9HEMI